MKDMRIRKHVTIKIVLNKFFFLLIAYLRGCMAVKLVEVSLVTKTVQATRILDNHLTWPLLLH